MNQQQQRMWERTAGRKPRVYQVTPGGMIWWADCRDESDKYHCDMLYSREAALQRAAKYAAGVFE